jgi:hypothetical protein
VKTSIYSPELKEMFADPWKGMEQSNIYVQITTIHQIAYFTLSHDFYSSLANISLCTKYDL